MTLKPGERLLAKILFLTVCGRNTPAIRSGGRPARAKARCQLNVLPVADPASSGRDLGWWRRSALVE